MCDFTKRKLDEIASLLEPLGQLALGGLATSAHDNLRRYVAPVDNGDLGHVIPLSCGSVDRFYAAPGLIRGRFSTSRKRRATAAPDKPMRQPLLPGSFKPSRYRKTGCHRPEPSDPEWFMIIMRDAENDGHISDTPLARGSADP